MTEHSTAFTEKMAQLKNDYLAALPQKLITIAEQAQTLKDNPSCDTSALLHRSVHSLIGSSGTFGFMALSQAARRLETLLKSLTARVSETNPIDALAFEEIEEKIAALFSVLQSIQALEKKQ